MVTAFAALILAGQDNETELYRTFTEGQTLKYEFKSHILTEGKTAIMSFYMPEEFDVNYGFTFKVESARQDGFASGLYERPSMEFIEGETAEHPPKSKVEKVGWKFRLTLSPINELTDVKDLNPKKPKDKDGGLFRLAGGLGPSSQDDRIGRMISELHSLAMFVGNLDSALDFAPKLPLDPVKPGATWKKTVSYQPREIKGTDRQAVQRLDYTYTYEGLVAVGGKNVHRIKAALDLDTDAAKFINQVMGTKPEDSGLKELRLKLKTNVTFDLDQNTRTTLSAFAESKGLFSIVQTEDPETPAFEEKMTGRGSLTLVGGK